jgi:hypothetical protein
MASYTVGECRNRCVVETAGRDVFAAALRSGVASPSAGAALRASGRSERRTTSEAATALRMVGGFAGTRPSLPCAEADSLDATVRHLVNNRERES